jgi:FtsP/CotA-like multicopper oxidase with cupredoxin domain
MHRSPRIVLWLLACALGSSGQTPLRIQTHDNTHPAGATVAGERLVRLVIGEGRWFSEAETGPSALAQAFGEEGGPLQIPGPLIRVKQGEFLRVAVRNSLTVPARVYGLHEHPGDAKQFLEVPPGEQREVRFLPGEPGLYLYWATTTNKSLEDRDGPDETLGGALVVDPADATSSSAAIFVIQHLDVKPDPAARPETSGGEIWAINGKMWPYVPIVQAQQGDTLRWRWLNGSYEPHPLHLHGNYFRVLATGDREHEQPAPAGQQAATFDLAAGKTLTLEWSPMRPGNWLFHCHIVYHVMQYMGIFEKVANPKPTDLPMGRDAHQHMSGLVVGIKVAPRAGKKSPATSYAHARKLDLYLRERGFNYPPPKDAPMDLPAVGFELRENGESSGPPSAPGPVIVLERGRPVEITVHNELKEMTSIHWHGIELESYYDGVAGWGGDEQRVTPAVPAGGQLVVRYTPPRAGTFIYHAHINDYYQIPNGLNGALIILEPGKKWDSDRERVVLLGRDGWDDVNAPNVLNGSAKPQPWKMTAGKNYRIRIINITPAHPRKICIQRDGKPLRWRAIAKDGADLPPNLAVEGPAENWSTAGETYDFAYSPTATGTDLLSVWNKDVSKEIIRLPIEVSKP